VAASYSEMARRLDRRERASEFLLQNQPAFRRIFRARTAKARAGEPPTLEAARAELEPFNIAGLCDPAKQNWYDVDLEDVVRGAAKLGCAPNEVSDFFARMRW
jgi:FADH2 O2-dependent halogenase